MKASRFAIDPARPGDFPAVVALLQEAGLPAEDLPADLAHFVVARDPAGTVVGTVGAEVQAPHALLRSLAVAPAWRGGGVGDALLRALEVAAAEWRVERWWLLTTTAEAYFLARDFVRAERSAAPAFIQGTAQFRGGCARTAVCLTRERRDHAPGPQEFDRTVQEFTDRLRNFIRGRVRDQATADDLTQETLLKVYRSRATLRENQRLEAWIYRIARTTLIDYYRKRKPTEELPEALRSEAPDETGEFRESVIAAMKRYLEELPPAYREPVRLAELEGLPLAKIALRSGLSLTAVKSRVRRGRAMLKRKLQDCCRFEFDRQGTIIGWERKRPVPCTC